MYIQTNLIKCQHVFVLVMPLIRFFQAGKYLNLRQSYFASVHYWYIIVMDSSTLQCPFHRYDVDFWGAWIGLSADTSDPDYPYPWMWSDGYRIFDNHWTRWKDDVQPGFSNGACAMLVGTYWMNVDCNAIVPGYYCSYSKLLNSFKTCLFFYGANSKRGRLV